MLNFLLGNTDRQFLLKAIDLLCNFLPIFVKYLAKVCVNGLYYREKILSKDGGVVERF